MWLPYRRQSVGFYFTVQRSLMHKTYTFGGFYRPGRMQKGWPVQQHEPALSGRSGVTRVLSCATQHLGEAVGCGDDRACVQATWLAAQTLDRTGDRHCRDNATRWPTHRGGHGSHAGLTLRDGLRPTAAAHSRQNGRGELGALETAV
jgi:hypothetical protein